MISRIVKKAMKGNKSTDYCCICYEELDTNEVRTRIYLKCGHSKNMHKSCDIAMLEQYGACFVCKFGSSVSNLNDKTHIC